MYENGDSGERGNFTCFANLATGGTGHLIDVVTYGVHVEIILHLLSWRHCEADEALFL